MEELSQYKEITGFNAHLNIHVSRGLVLGQCRGGYRGETWSNGSPLEN